MKFNELKTDKNIRKIITALIIIVSASAAACFLYAENRKITSEDLKRPDYGEISKQLPVSVYADGLSEKIDTDIEIIPKIYSPEEVEQLFLQTYEELRQIILKDNSSLMNVKSDLNLVESLDGNPVSIQWFSSNYDLIGYDGSVHIDGLGDNREMEAVLTVQLEYREYKSVYEIRVVVNAPELSENERISGYIKSEVSRVQASGNGDYIQLPGEIDGRKITYEKRGDLSVPAAIIIMGAGAVFCVFYADRQKKKRFEQERQRQLKSDYSEMITKLTLLIGAGMTVRMAWEKIVYDYQRQKKSGRVKMRYVYEEMNESLVQLKRGMSERAVYERFGVRCRIREYMKFSSLLIQNLKKGTRELTGLLELEAIDAFEERKNQVKKYGEEAGTKLLVPMVIMLIVVMIIIMFPAIMTFTV